MPLSGVFCSSWRCCAASAASFCCCAWSACFQACFASRGVQPNCAAKSRKASRMPMCSIVSLTWHDTIMGDCSTNVLATMSGSAWNFVQKDLKCPRLSMHGTKMPSQEPISDSTCPR